MASEQTRFSAVVTIKRSPARLTQGSFGAIRSAGARKALLCDSRGSHCARATSWWRDTSADALCVAQLDL